MILKITLPPFPIVEYIKPKELSELILKAEIIKDNIEELNLDFDVGEICCQTQYSLNEFYLVDINSDDYIMIELVNREVAIKNDKDFIDKEDLHKYALCGEYSMYRRLGLTNYYWRIK